MKIEFKFSNDVFASVDLFSKTIYPNTKEMDGDFPCAPPIYYSTDDEMVDALKKVSEMVNLNQHDDIREAIFNHFNGASMLYNSDGSLEILFEYRDDFHGLTVDEFEPLLESLGAEYIWGDDYCDDHSVQVNGKRIASITFKY